MTSKWIYQGVPLEQAPEDAIGFVYKVVNKLSGEYYIGQKSFWSVTNPKLSKKASLAAWSGKGRKPTRNKGLRRESDWKKYCTSSKVVKDMVNELGVDSFEWIILSLHNNKTEMLLDEAFKIADEMCNPLCKNLWLKLTITKKGLSCQ